MKPLRLILLLVAAGSVWPAQATNVWSSALNVAEVYARQDGNFLLVLDAEVDSGCTTAGTDTLYFSVAQNGMTAEGITGMQGDALTALTTGMDVKIYYDDASTYCFAKYFKVITP